MRNIAMTTVSTALPEYEEVEWPAVYSRIQLAMDEKLPPNMVSDYITFSFNQGNVESAIDFINMVHSVRENLVMKYNAFCLFKDLETRCSLILQAIHSIDYYVESCDEYAFAVRLTDLD